MDAVLSVRPSPPPRILRHQLERERAIQGQTGQTVRAVDTLGRPIESPASEPMPSVRIQAFVQLANDRMRSNQLTGKDSAHQYLLSARQLNAKDPGVVEAVASLGILYRTMREDAPDNRLADASRWSNRQDDVTAPRSRRCGGHRRARQANRADNGKSTCSPPRTPRAALSSPKPTSARITPTIRARTDSTAATRARFASRALAESRTALAAIKQTRRCMLRAGRGAGAPAAENSELSSKSVAEIGRPPCHGAACRRPEPMPASSRPDIRPARASAIRIWVDLDFGVTKDGTTRTRV